MRHQKGPASQHGGRVCLARRNRQLTLQMGPLLRKVCNLVKGRVPSQRVISYEGGLRGVGDVLSGLWLIRCTVRGSKGGCVQRAALGSGRNSCWYPGLRMSVFPTSFFLCPPGQ